LRSPNATSRLLPPLTVERWGLKGVNRSKVVDEEEYPNSPEHDAPADEEAVTSHFADEGNPPVRG
jgi:hypothetical protein